MPDIHQNLCGENCARWWTSERWITRGRRKVQLDRMRWWDRMQMSPWTTISTRTQTTCQCRWPCSSSSSNNSKWRPIPWWTPRTWVISICRRLVSINQMLSGHKMRCLWQSNVSVRMCSHVYCHHCIVYGINHQNTHTASTQPLLSYLTWHSLNWCDFLLFLYITPVVVFISLKSHLWALKLGLLHPHRSWIWYKSTHTNQLKTRQQFDTKHQTNRSDRISQSFRFWILLSRCNSSRH